MSCLDVYARKHDCEACALKTKCDRARSIYEAARDKARAIAKTEAYAVTRQSQKVEMLFAHLKRILWLDRLRLRGPSGAKDEFLLAATAQNLRKLAKLIPLPAPYSPHEAAQLNFASPAAAAGAIAGTRGFSAQMPFIP